MYRLAADQLLSVCPPERILLTANGTAMADALSSIVNAKVHCYPIPKAYPADLTETPDTDAKQNRISIGVFGDMTPYKGIDLIPHLVESTKGVRWLVQEPHRGIETCWSGKADSMATHPDVTLFAAGLPGTKYYEMFRQADIILAPYDSKQKQLQSSGIISEAAAAGKVIVAPRTAWITEHYLAGNLAGCLFDNQSVGTISAAIETAIRDFDSLSTRARSLAEKWRREQTVSAYLDATLRYFGLFEQGVVA